MKRDNNDVAAAGAASQDVLDGNQRKEWEPMRLTYSGDAKDIVRGGGGKLGITQADMGDTNKPQGQT